MPKHNKFIVFLESLDGHAIYDADELAMDFAKEAGGHPCWPVHSVKAAEARLHDRGLGGWIEGPRHRRVAYGYEIAEALAEKFANHRNPGLHGLGFRFRAAALALKEARDEGIRL